MFHLTVRVAWHDSRWNGCVCQDPQGNTFCTELDRIRMSRDDESEKNVANHPWNELSVSDLPPCKAESGAFMNPHEWTREFVHPYANIKKASETHGHLKPTLVKVPEYATFAVPFGWMLRSEQKSIDERLPKPLPPDKHSPFNSAWVFGFERQEALLKHFFGRINPGKSLVLFYCKGGHPLGDHVSRLVVGVGRILSVGNLNQYNTDKKKPTSLMWDGLFRHSIRPDGVDGFLLPYHDYLEPTGDPEEDARRASLLLEIAVPVDPAHMRTFSYAAELALPDVTLSTLIACLDSVRKIRAHGIAKGPWERREEWLNAQIAATWKERGAYPGLGSALEALGMRLGTALSLEMYASQMVHEDGDPWPVIDGLLRGKLSPPQKAYQPDLDAMRNTWVNISPERLALLKLLSRMALTPAQAKRWFQPTKRAAGTSVPVNDTDILANPYRMTEVDLGERNDSPVSIGVVDRGLLPDANIATKHPIPEPSTVKSSNDPRRIRAALVSVLRNASDNGDALLSTVEVLNATEHLKMSPPCSPGSDWPDANRSILAGVIELLNVVVDTEPLKEIPALQLSELKRSEDRLRSVLSKRAEKVLPTLQIEWESLLIKAISEAGGCFDATNDRHVAAIDEQASALAKITSRKLTVLTGRAGTGKTSVLGALLLCEQIAQGGILLLAPTGKARVRLGHATNAEAMTVAQFLNKLNRYDSDRQRPLLTGTEKYRAERTVVIDESSMLTMDYLVATIEALDLAHVQRLILVGDPNQLPPIGVGRPFADLIAYFESTDSSAEDGTPLKNALARLTVEVRTSTSSAEPSDALRLAAWFTREIQPVDADRILSDLESGKKFNDLDVLFWKNPEELRSSFSEAFIRHLGMKDSSDISGFDTSLGFNEEGLLPFESPNGAEQWQILSPVRMNPHGVNELNRWVQRRFRGKELRAAANPWVVSLGDETIVRKDKVIQTINQWRDGFDGKSEEQYLANGEVGIAATEKSGYLNVLFANRPCWRFGYSKRDFQGGSGPLSLAYALTVHKAQGSEFKKVFVVLPKNCRILSRELIYTSMTRSRVQLVLLIEGDNPSVLFDYSRPERSETERRNTNIFQGVVRGGDEEIPYAKHLIHRTEKGHLVRSKSELNIADKLYHMGLEYEYERICEGTIEPGRMRPDFSFVTAGGDLILWEHLGMLNRPDYKAGWEWKLRWYEKNGFFEGKNLFTTQDTYQTPDDSRGRLDSRMLAQTALRIKALLD